MREAHPSSRGVGPAEVMRLLFGEGASTRISTLPVVSGCLEYVQLPHPDRATLLVPATPGRVAAATLRDYGAANSRRARLLSRGAAPLGRMGALRLVPRRLVVDAPPHGGLIRHAQDLLGERIVPAVQLGPVRPNRKPVVQLRSPGGEALAYMKVGINPLTRDRVANEAWALERLHELAPPQLTVPTLLHHGEFGELNYLIIGTVDTQAGVALDEDVVSRAMSGLARVSTVSSPELSGSDWWTHIMAELEGLDGEEATALRDAADRLRRSQGERRLLIGAAHGDWAPWNMATRGEHAVVWDWERFREGVPVGWDSIHFEVERNRRAGLGAHGAISHVTSTVDRVVARNGADPYDGLLLLATYLLDLGSRQLQTRSPGALDSRGSLITWLVPTLQDSVDAVEASRD